jgi:alpha-N-arabinofuranosidase
MLFIRFTLFYFLVSVTQTLMAQANLPLYTENLVNSVQDWSYNCNRNFTNTSPVHTGGYSIAVTNAYGGTIQLHSPTFSTVPYANFSFWINGGPTGGQVLRVYGMLNGSWQTTYTLPALVANSWQQFTIPLTSLGVANKANFNGVVFQSASGGAQPVYYLDDLQIGAATTPATVHLNVDANQTIRQADSRWFAMNTWINHDGDSTINLGNPQTATLLRQAGVQVTRWPGGSKADYFYNWYANQTDNLQFYQTATNLGINSQAFITVNYGSGTPADAAGWVADANITNRCGFKYWEIGNECYGTWELDINTNNGYVAHDPYTYAVRAAQYMQLMRAVDPNIKIGVVATPGDSSSINNNNHSAYNARTGQTVYGWTPVMLATLKSLGAQPDFLIYHYYAQFSDKPWVAPSPSADSDPLLLQQNNWSGDAATLRQEISDYYGTGGTNIELCVTELNSDVSNGGRQMCSIVNGLYMADTISKLMQTEFNSVVWFGLRDYQGTGGDMDPTLYGWRNYGDYAVIHDLNGLYPTYYSMKLLQYFVRPGDTILNASSDYPLLSAYASRRSDGALNMLVINKDVAANFNGQINLANFAPATNATIHFYGLPQDNAAKNGLSATLQDIAMTNYSGAGSQFNYSFPPYSLTLFTFLPTNYITLSLPMGAGVDWNTASYWSDGNPASVSASASPAVVYDVLAGALLRSPVTGGATFPGNRLIVNGDGNWVSGGGSNLSEFRLVSSPVTVPWLQMNGGQFDVSGTANSQSVLNGRLDILANTPIYNDPANDEGLTVNAFLSDRLKIQNGWNGVKIRQAWLEENTRKV